MTAAEKRLQDLTEIGESLDQALKDMKLSHTRRKVSFSRTSTPDGYQIVENDSSIPGDTYRFEYLLTTPNTFGMDDIIGMRDAFTLQRGSIPIDQNSASLQIKAEIERVILNKFDVSFLRKYYILVSIDQILSFKEEDNAMNTLQYELFAYVSFME